MLAAAFPRASWRAESEAVYVMALTQARIPTDVAQRAIATLITDEAMLPPVAHVLSRCREIQDGRASTEPTQTLFDLYGSNRDDWAHCWRCDMAITLEERSTVPRYREGYGLYHFRCPKPGTAPIMSPAQRAQRAEWMARKGR